ncbi:MAG: hypothetical protein DLM55_09690 [Acidimicrobiales bacterium]|nr:MAG: hypothetical protein DLM55_09690 [Acidimicrobiales bacterium]
MSEQPRATYVFDVHPLLSYARSDSLLIPSIVAASIEHNQYIAVSAVTLAMAYCELTEDEALILDMLSGGHLAMAFVMKPLDASTARYLGGQARVLSSQPSLSTLHTADIAQQAAATVVTGDR